MSAGKGPRARPYDGTSVDRSTAGGISARATGTKGFGMLGHAGSHGRSMLARVRGGGITDTWTRTIGPLDWGTSDSGLVWWTIFDSVQDSWVQEVDGSRGVLGLIADTKDPGLWTSSIHTWLSRPGDGGGPLPKLTDTTEVRCDVTLSDIPASGNVQLRVYLGGDTSEMYVCLFPVDDVIGVEGGGYTPWGTQEITPTGFTWTDTIHVHALREPDGDRMRLSASLWQGEIEPGGWMVYDRDDTAALDTEAYFSISFGQLPSSPANGPTTVQARFDNLRISSGGDWATTGLYAGSWV